MPSIIAGHVFDKENRPLGKVKIMLKGKVVAESGSDGFFSVSLVKSEERVAITFAAEGYVPNTRVYNVKSAGNGSTVVVWPIAYRVKFDPTRDLDIELGGTHIQIPADALVSGGGVRSKNIVELRFTLFDITSAFQRAAAPGDFSGRMLDRSIRRLNSYGIFSSGLHDLKGHPLDLRRGASINLAIPVPSRLTKDLPRQVGYFDFDAVAGLWDQVGNFDLVSDTLTYNGSVTSFGGEHNCDIPQDTVCVTLHVQDSWGNPLPNANVTAHGAQYSSQGTSNANGDVCLLVQRNASFWAEAWGQLGTTFFTSAPFAQQNFTSPNFSSGASDCGNSALCPTVGDLLVDYAVGLFLANLSAREITSLRT
jgi:hypothetical protein